MIDTHGVMIEWTWNMYLWKFCCLKKQKSCLAFLLGIRKRLSLSVHVDLAKLMIRIKLCFYYRSISKKMETKWLN